MQKQLHEDGSFLVSFPHMEMVPPGPARTLFLGGINLRQHRGPGTCIQRQSCSSGLWRFPTDHDGNLINFSFIFQREVHVQLVEVTFKMQFASTAGLMQTLRTRRHLGAGLVCTQLPGSCRQATPAQGKHPALTPMWVLMVPGGPHVG